MIGRVDVEAYNVADLQLKSRIAGNLEGLDLVRLEAFCCFSPYASTEFPD